MKFVIDSSCWSQAPPMLTQGHVTQSNQEIQFVMLILSVCILWVCGVFFTLLCLFSGFWFVFRVCLYTHTSLALCVCARALMALISNSFYFSGPVIMASLWSRFKTWYWLNNSVQFDSYSILNKIFMTEKKSESLTMQNIGHFCPYIYIHTQLWTEV